MDTGSVVVLQPVSGAAPVGYGQLQAGYAAPATFLTHPAQWSIDGGSWRQVGSPAQQVYAGAHVIRIVAVHSSDSLSFSQTISVPPVKLVKMTVAFAPK